MPRGRTKIGLVQMRCGDDPQDNLARAEAGIREAAGKEAQLVCLPELFRSRYFCQTEDHERFELAEPVPGPTTDRLGELARELHVAIVSSHFEKRAEGLYHNTSAVTDADGTFAGKYRKMHIPDDPLFYEKFYFTPGDLGFRAFETQVAKVAPLVCWDQWFPEAARHVALQGAELIVYPTAIGWHPSEKERFGEAQHASWELMQRSHAVANGCFVAAVNRIGHEGPADGGIEFWGRSFVAGPDGTVIERASTDEEQVLVVELDMAKIDEQRTHWPFLRDRRIDAYEGLMHRYLDEERPR